MSAYLAGTDLVGLLLKISLGETPPPCRKAATACGPIWRCRRCWDAPRVAAGGAMSSGNAGALPPAAGPYAGSAEEMTPLRLDWISAVPLAMIAMVLLAALTRGFAGARRLGRASARCREHARDRE